MSMNATKAMEYLGERLDALAEGKLTYTSTIHVELPDDDQADVAIKIHCPVTNDRLVVQGIAHYIDGRLVGEKHTQMGKDLSFTWAKDHQHAPIGCLDFSMSPEGVFLPTDKAPDVPPTRLYGNHGLGMATMTIIDMEQCGTAYDLVYGEMTRKRAAALHGNGEPGLFIDPALQLALDQQLGL